MVISVICLLADVPFLSEPYQTFIVLLMALASYNTARAAVP